MCALHRLENVREQMKAQTCLITVRDADHGMIAKPKQASKDIVTMTCISAAKWLKNRKEDRTESEIFWDSEKEKAIHGEWVALSTEHHSKREPAESLPKLEELRVLKRKRSPRGTAMDTASRPGRASKHKKAS